MQAQVELHRLYNRVPPDLSQEQPSLLLSSKEELTGEPILLPSAEPVALLGQLVMREEMANLAEEAN